MSNTETPKIENTDAACCLRMESVDRIGKLPVVESTIETANNIYGKIKVIYLFAFPVCRIEIYLETDFHVFFFNSIAEFNQRKIFYYIQITLCLFIS